MSLNNLNDNILLMQSLKENCYACIFFIYTSISIISISLFQDKDNMKADVRNLDHRLAPYPYQSYNKWLMLSSRIK